MKIVLPRVTLYLGKIRKDGTRNVERVRPSNLRDLLPALRRAKIPAKMAGKRLCVRVEDADQRKQTFMADAS